MESCSILVVAHFFYPSIWPEVAQCIRNVRQAATGRVDVFVTFPESHDEYRSMVEEDFPGAVLVPVENRGYDVAPFFKVLNSVNLSDYDAVVKLHTKRDLETAWVNFRRLKGSAWRRELLSFCSTRRRAERSLSALRRNPRLGMIGSRLLIDPSGCGSGYDVKDSARVLEGLGVQPCGRTVLYGTMFMMRASLLLPAWRKVRYEDFSLIKPGREHCDLALAGAWEGAFGMLVNAQGFYVSDGSYPQWLDLILLKVREWVYRFLRTASNFVRGV